MEFEEIKDELMAEIKILHTQYDKEIEEFYKTHERKQTLDSPTFSIEKKYHKLTLELIEKYKKREK